MLVNVRYSPLVHLMMVRVCGAVMVSAQTFDSGTHVYYHCANSN